MDRPRRRVLATIAALLAPLATGCQSLSGDGSDEETTSTPPTATTPETKTTTAESTESCTTAEDDLVEDLVVRDERQNETPFTVRVTRRDGAVAFEHTYADGDGTPSTSNVFERATRYTVSVSVEGGDAATQDVDVTGEDWMRRYGIYVAVEADGVSISEYHGEPVCP